MPKMDQLLNDKNVLYIIFVVAILNLLGYLITNNLEAVVFFLIVGFLSTYFSKNMIIVLIIAIVTTSIFATTRTPKIIYANKEGMGTMRAQKKKQMQIKKQILQNNSDEQKDSSIRDRISSNRNDSSESESEIEGMDGIHGEPQNQSKAKGTGNRIDYANTLEKAYENLQSSIGKEGIRGLTEQTAGLLNQQKELMDNINSMQPFLQTAEGFLKNLDFSGIENIGNILNKFSGDKKQ